MHQSNCRTGHTKAVSKVLFLPRTGHLVLSGSMDGRAKVTSQFTLKIWDVYHKNVALRTFIGHNKGIKDISFNVDGTRFLTGSFDKFIKLWDTETGKCVQSYALSTVPNCLTFNPEPGNQHIFLAGCADNKIRQYDINAGVVTRDYSNHDGAVNCVTFLADKKRFVSSSDDKSLRVWEFGSPQVIKYIYEEEFFSMPSVILHPNGKRMVCQSLDDQILVFSAQDRYKKHRKKFLGHQISGFSCQIISSPDGQHLMSGDSSGNAWFWDWSSARILRKFKAHDMILNSCAWHPIEPSKIATCSWDSTIKIWE
jgi:pre-mRNA-processing factor 17